MKQGEGARFICRSAAILLPLLFIFTFNALGEEPVDSDSDGMPDHWESLHGLDPDNSTDSGGDPDNDTLSNLQEYENGIDPNGNDTDSDGMEDPWEIENGLDPTDPADADEDPDGDGLINLAEYLNGTDPNQLDSDSDGMDDGWEVRYDLDPNDPTDAREDADGDNRTNLDEYINGSDPLDEDSPAVEPGDDDDTEPCEGEEDEAGAAASLCVLFLIPLGGIIVLIIGIGFYSKIRRDKLLEHEKRQEIVEYLKENPGAHYSALLKDLDLSHGVLTHHLNMLETQEVVFSKQDRNYRRFYLDGMSARGHLVVGTQKRILEAIRRKPGSTQSEIARNLDMSRMIVNYHVGELVKLDLISKEKDGRASRLYARSLKGEGIPYGGVGAEGSGEVSAEV